MRAGPTLGDHRRRRRRGTPAQQRTVRRDDARSLALGIIALVVDAPAMTGAHHASIRSAVARTMSDVIVGDGACSYFGYLFLFARPRRRRAEAHRRHPRAVRVLGRSSGRRSSRRRRRSTSSRATSPTGSLGGWEVPATWFQSVNSLFVILFAPVLRRAVGWRSRSAAAISRARPSSRSGSRSPASASCHARRRRIAVVAGGAGDARLDVVAHRRATSSRRSASCRSAPSA